MQRRRRSNLQNFSALESRRLLSSTTPQMYIAGSGQLVVIGTDGNDTCTISETTVSGIPQIKVTMNRKSVNFARHLVTADSVYFLGGKGNDFLQMAANVWVYAAGQDGNDTLYGSDQADVLIGSHGNDLLKGFGGADQLYGDTTTTGSADGAISPEQGKDILYGGAGNDTVSGGALADMLYGEADSDTLYGGSDDDHLDGGLGADYLWGGWANDRLFGGADVDELFGEEGHDALYGGAAFDWLYGNDGDDFLDGQADDAYYSGGKGLDTAANQPVIGGVGPGDIFQQGSQSCWFLAGLGAMTNLGATNNGADISSYMTYKGEGVFNVRIYNFKKKVWTTQAVNFEGGRSTHNGDAQVISRGDTNASNDACEGEFWATVIHRGMVKYYKADYTTATGVANANFGFGAGRGGNAKNGLLLLGNTTATEEAQSTQNPFNLAFLARMRTLLNRTNPIQPMIVGTRPSPPSTKLVSAHSYQIVSIDASGNVVLRNPWGVDGGTGGDGVNDGQVTVTAAEFAANFNQVAYTSSPVA
jgi:hypothetical protein